MAEEDDRRAVEDELRRVRDQVRDGALLEEPKSLGAPRPTTPSRPTTSEPLPTLDLPSPPDAGAVNEAWRVELPQPPGGVRGRLARAVWELLRPYVDAQRDFNSRQVQLDNATLDYIGRRFAATHQQYDRALGLHMQRMEDIDKRHLILQEEVVAHVHDLVQRIDLVLAEGERGRMSAEFALRDVRTRLARLEAQLQDAAAKK